MHNFDARTNSGLPPGGRGKPTQTKDGRVQQGQPAIVETPTDPGVGVRRTAWAHSGRGGCDRLLHEARQTDDVTEVDQCHLQMFVGKGRTQLWLLGTGFRVPDGETLGAIHWASRGFGRWARLSPGRGRNEGICKSWDKEAEITRNGEKWPIMKHGHPFAELDETAQERGHTAYTELWMQETWHFVEFWMVEGDETVCWELQR